jgi:putative tricarboxylic transport membrane protein
VLNLPLVRIWVKLLEIPRELLYSLILVFATFGVYAISNSVADVVIMYVVGVVGFLMRRYDFPLAPMVLGLILGPLMEAQLRRALSISQGDWTVFLTRPLSLVLLLLAVAGAALPLIGRVRSARDRRRSLVEAGRGTDVSGRTEEG